jgi:hypothetical protein
VNANAEKQLKRVREICEALPGTVERLSHGEPTFFAVKKVFTMFSNDHHEDGHLAVCVPAPDGAQEFLIESDPQTYFRPAYVGHRGWIGIELENINDAQLKEHIHEAWRIVAPKKLLKEFPESDDEI